jgi:hypothetical protein
VDDRELARRPERLQRFQARVQAEEAVEVEGARVAAAGASNRDARPRPVVLLFAERHDDVEAVDGAALEDRDELLRPA